MLRGCKRFVFVVTLATLSVLPLLALGAQRASADPATFTLRAGDGERGFAVNLFLPNAIFINADDTVRWTFPWFEPHTVTFGSLQGRDPNAPSHAPGTVVDFDGTQFVNSGLLFGDPAQPASFEMRFTQAGEFAYLCAIHPFMTGTVRVGGQSVDNQASIDARGEGDFGSALMELEALAAGLGARPVAITPRAGGGRTFTLTVAGETRNGDVQQFFPPSAGAGGRRPPQVNDAIVWKSDVRTPHTVTFGQPPQPVTDPFAIPPSKPAASFDGTGFWHSGIIGVGFPGGTTFEMVFSSTGTFNYICLLHANQGMVGSVTVVAAPVAPLPPVTGTGTASGDSREGLFVVAGVVLGAVLVAVSTVCAAGYQGLSSSLDSVSS